MKTKYTFSAKLTTYLFLALLFFGIQNSKSQSFCTNSDTHQFKGEKNGFYYELWNQNSQGTACITLDDGSDASFSGSWNGIFNYLARRGLKYNQTQEHQEIGEFYTTYDCVYNPSAPPGNSYLSVYGWTIEPLIEYYIIEDWRNFKPANASGSINRGSFTVNGSVYDVYENTRTEKPSIVGTATFQQYFSIRRDERNSGTIDISEHFKYWESLGMEMGKLHEVSFVVEGYKSEGNFDFNSLDVFVDKSSLSVNESEFSKLFKIYPNPSSGNVSIQLDNTLTKSNINIFDITGKLVYNENNIKTNSVNVSKLKSGVYFVKVNNNKTSYTKKLIVY